MFLNVGFFGLNFANFVQVAIPVKHYSKHS